MNSRFQSQSKRNTGFTLIELLVVIGILAILLVFAFPTFQKMRSAAHSAKCLSNLRQYGNAMTALAADYDGLPSIKGKLDDYSFKKFLVPDYLHEELQCPIEMTRNKGEYGKYAGNRRLAEFHPKFNGITIPTSKMVMAMENYVGSGVYSTTHPRNSVDFKLNHGTEEAPALHILFVDGHARRVVSPNSAWSEPEGIYFRDPSTNDKEQRAARPPVN